MRIAVPALAAVLALAACNESPAPASPTPPGPAAGASGDNESAQQRAFLKNPTGDWTGDTGLARGAPEPSVEPTPVPGARLIDLPDPAPSAHGAMPLGDVIATRRSRRGFSAEPLSLGELSFLLWSTQGVTGTLRNDAGEVTHRLRATPSGGARFPLDTFVVARRVDGLPAGVYRYLPAAHQLEVVREDPSAGERLHAACFGSAVAANPALAFVWAAVPARTEWKYGPLSPKMIAIEAGHACQNLYLAAESGGAGACALLGYHQPAIDDLLGLDGQDSFTVYLAVVGRPVQ